MVSLTASCGHPVPFDMQSPDPYREAKVAKIVGRKCRACRIAEAEALNRSRILAARGGRIKKGQEAKHMPAGTVITLTRLDDGTWVGRLIAEGHAVEAESAGLMGMASKLARRWLAAHGATLRGRVT